MHERRVISVTGMNTAKHNSVRPFNDHTFDILGRPTADVVDIGAVFAQASVRMGDGVWVGYVPVQGQLTCRVRVSRQPVHSGGDAAGMALVFDERLLRDRWRSGTLARGSCLLVDEGAESGEQSPPVDVGLCVHPLPLREWAAQVPGLSGGERLVALGMLAWMYDRDPDVIRRLLENRLAFRGGRVISAALRLFELGWREAPRRAPYRYELYSSPEPAPAAAASAAVPALGAAGASGAIPTSAAAHRYALDGRSALVSGALAGHLGRCLPPPSHPLVDGFVRVYAERGGHVATPWELDGRGAGQPPDSDARHSNTNSNISPWLAVQIAGCETDEFASDGYGHELDQRTSGDTPIPRVTLRIERVLSHEGPLFPSWINPLSGPADLLARHRPLVLAPTTVEQCFQFMNVAGRIAAHYRRDVTVLVDALLLGVVQEWPRSDDDSNAVFHSDVVPGAFAFDVSHAGTRAQAAVDSLLSGLGLPGTKPEDFLCPVQPAGGDRGELLLVGWGATRGPVEEAIRGLRAAGIAVSSVHLTTLNPLPPEFGVLLSRFRRVVAIDVLTERCDASRRVRQLHTLLRGAIETTPATALGIPTETVLATGTRTASESVRVSAVDTENWMATDGRERQRSVPPRLDTHVFSYSAPLTPRSIERFVRSVLL